MRWEYKVAEADKHHAFEGLAQKLGQEHWELIHVEYMPTSRFVVGFFKRPIEATGEPEFHKQETIVQNIKPGSFTYVPNA